MADAVQIQINRWVTEFAGLERALRNAFKGEDPNYYLMDVKHVEDKISAKVQIAVKVFVPETDRVKATKAIHKALIEDAGEAIIKTTGKSADRELDFILEGEAGKRDSRVIRIEVKPSNAKGSGGGSAATKVQEAGAALFCAIRFDRSSDITESNRPTPAEIDKAWAKVDCDNKVELDEIISMPSEWYESFSVGANRLYQEMKSCPGLDKYYFVRGDKTIEKAISEAFKRVKDQTRISAEDKWNPADIWMYKGNKDTIAGWLNQETTIDCLNNLLQQSFSDKIPPNPRVKDKKVTPKSLIGISLKKINNSARCDTINQESWSDRKKDETAGFAKYGLVFDNNRKKDPHPMDVYFYHGSGSKDRFQARNFGGGGKDDWKLELDGVHAKQGKMQGDVLRRFMKHVFSNTAGVKLPPREPKWEHCDPGINNTNIKTAITNEIYKLLSKHKATGMSTMTVDKNKINTAMDQSHRYSKLCGLRFLDWMMSLSDLNRNKAMKEMYLYASSKGQHSSVYYKLW